MSSTCPACHRLNPPQARYCFHDGVPLAGATSTGPIRVGSRPFLTPFVFPSGRSCKNFDELVHACEDEWAAARDMLKQGFFVGFLGGLGRADSAQAAREAARDSDADRALDEFLARLPGERTPPQLTVEPREINLGQLDPARPRAFALTLSNQGAGLLGGTARTQCPWLLLGDAPGVVEKHFACRGDFTLPVQVKLANLRAGGKALEGHVVIQAGNDFVTVVVRASREVVPFAHGKLAGATTPRRLAELARDNARDAAQLFASGQVARWYESNGWTYPVQGPPAAGLGAVQQYFEALGLAKPPKVRISASRVELAGAPGGSVEHFLFVESDEKRAVFARALSEVDWLEVVAVKYQANSARIHLRVSSVPHLPGQRLTGRLTVISNGNQRFDVETSLQIQGKTFPTQPPPSSPARSSHEPPPVRRGPTPMEVFSAPVAIPFLEATSAEVVEEVRVAPLPIELPPEPVYVPPPTPPPEPRWSEPVVYPTLPPAREPAYERPAGPTLLEDDTPAPRRRGGVLHLLAPLLILLLLLGTVIHDLLLPAVVGSAEDDLIDATPLLALRFHDGDNPDTFKTPEKSMAFGIAVRATNKKLVFDELGRTNNVCVKIDGDDYFFGFPDVVITGGGEPQRVTPVVGSWIDMKTPLGKTKRGRERDGWRSTWRIVGRTGDLGIDVTQTVELVPGEQSMRLDTVLVRYSLHNRGSRGRQVGIRFLLDTFIGDNDGVPFTIPGEAGLCSTKRRFDRPEEVPDYIQALENENLLKPGTVAHLQLRMAGDVEAPSRMLLGGYPDAPLAELGHRKARVYFTGWDVPFVNVRELLDNQGRLKEPPRRVPEPDSAVTMYWDVKSLSTGGKREVGFSYGLGEVASADGQGKLLLTVGGRTVRGGEFSVTALRAEPQPGERLTLRLPKADGLEIQGSAEQEVPKVAANAARPISTVTWRVRATRTGLFPIVVESSVGEVRQTQKVRISAPRAGVLD